MKITRNECILSPYTTIKMLRSNPMNRDFERICLLYGPHLVYDINIDSCLSYLQIENFDLIDVMLLGQYIRCIRNTGIMNIARRNEAARIYKSLILDEHMNFVKANAVKMLYDFLYGKKASESVLTGTAPIVPYQGTVQLHPFAKNAVMTDTCDEVQEIVQKSTTPSEVLHCGSEKIHQFLLEYYSSHTLEILDSVIDIATEVPFENFEEFKKGLDRYTTDLEHKNILAYYILCYYYFAKDQKACESFTEQYSTNALLSKDPDELLSMMESLTYGESPDIDETMQLMKEMDDRMFDLFEDTDTPDETLHNYPIDKLRNYLNTTHRYKPSKYLSSMFLSQNKTIDHYIMEIDGIPVAEVKNRYLVAPVIDYALYNKPTLISMDRDGNIKVHDSILELGPIS